MCEYCRCLGNNHHYMCPNYEEPDEPERLKCCVCDCVLWKDEPSDYVQIPPGEYGDIVCNDCLREYLLSNKMAE